MGKAYDVSSGKYEVAKKAFAVEGSKYVKLPKAFVVEGGKYVKLWSGGNTRFISNIVAGKSTSYYAYNFLIMDDFKNVSDVRMTTRESSTFIISSGHNFWNKNFFISSDQKIRVFQSDSDTYDTYEKVYGGYNIGYNDMHGKLSSGDDQLYAIALMSSALGGSSSGAGGFAAIYMIELSEDMSSVVTQLTASYGNSMDTRPAPPNWSYSSGDSSYTSSHVCASRGIVYNGKLYFMQLSKYYYGSSGMSYPTNRYGASLRVVDLSSGALATTSACSLGSNEYSQANGNGMNNEYACFYDVLGFSDGVLMFFDKSIYKLDSEGSSATKLTDIFSSTYACTFGKVIKITETVFVITGYTYNGNYQSKVYEFKNGTLTLLKSLGSSNYMYIQNSVVIDGALVCAYSVCSSTLGTADHYVLYSLDYGETWTKNKAEISVGNQTTNNTFYHTIAGDII